MKTTFKSISISAALAVTLLTSANAGGAASGGASEWTQLAQFAADTADRGSSYGTQLREYALQANQYRQQIQQYVNQYQAYENMLQNIGQLPPAQWNEFQQSVMGLKQALEFQESLAFTASSYDTDFRNNFPGYTEYLSAAASKTTQQNAYDFGNQYKQLRTTTRDTVNGSLQALNTRAEDMETDEGTMRTLSNLSQSASGQLSAIQAANEIALHQTHQLKKMEQTMMIQANMQGEYIAAQNEEKDLSKAKNDDFYNRGDFKDDPSKHKKSTRQL